ncbi:hypothetical protein G6F16_006541 [Rhizopus arrhizus]|uniref:ABC transporter domain-containing protein n=1 Tax=Rhizopus oryzae TaxID=64495 RepID=A0A9P6X4T4_RHIOR|nr:hypothetical protein G6F23_004051 [Rhizopus arrhizus]KAG0760173.1 hypothetical protein G6F24_008518 [Rhizopus arrhizus]KAG0793678.1 hypothetical protein G6F21_003435 [Rhizopus arrhizus]KAG0798427.1 hypothetical protein G6F22_004233 [Rhizopus arrhizus]KAG0810210.1 hypothetical protein G6F20_008150 [Rhizopus arrhizus]
MFWFIALVIDTVVGWSLVIEFFKYDLGIMLNFCECAKFSIFFIRYISELIIILIALARLFTGTVVHAEDSETSSLLDSLSTTTTTTVQYAKDGTKITAIKTIQVKKTKNQASALVLTKFTLTLWPHDDLKLQVYACFSLLLMTAGIAVNIWLPYKIGELVDGDMKEGKFAWVSVVVYTGLCYLQGELGLLQSLQKLSWAPVDSHIRHQASDYVCKLSKHGIHQGLSKSVESAKAAVDFLNQIIFQLFPLVVNVILVSIFCAYVFAPIFAVILLITVTSYMLVTVILMKKYRDSEDLECNKADDEHPVTSKIRIVQNSILTIGSLAGSLLFAYKVSLGELSSGGYITFNMFLMELCIPLHLFRKSYETAQSCLSKIDLSIESSEVIETIKYIRHDKEPKIKEQVIVFDHVNYISEASNVTLRDISFTISKGESLAIVGSPGSGKSTILQLLLRSLEPSSGNIFFNGCDIRQIDMDVFKKTTGIASQQVTIFNDSIYNNIKYGQKVTTIEEVKQAARVARIHDKIELLRSGYNTTLGHHNGYLLSKDETQRIAIARAILKNPSVILLDEVTKGLEMSTKGKSEILSDITKNRTALILSSSLDVVKDVNHILILCISTNVQKKYESIDDQGQVTQQQRKHFDKQISGDRASAILELSKKRPTHADVQLDESKINQHAYEEMKGRASYKTEHIHVFDDSPNHDKESAKQMAETVELHETEEIQYEAKSHEIIELDEETETHIIVKNEFIEIAEHEDVYIDGGTVMAEVIEIEL